MLDKYHLVNIVMVDDDELDFEAFRRALKSNNIGNQLFRARDGVEALALLRGETAVKVARPYVILMDINMPRMNGLECIKAMREDSQLHDAVIFVMTTSDDEQDIYEAYNLNVAGYMVKSNLGSNFLKTIEMLDRYTKATVFLSDRR